jgi:hypothetical protein
LIIINPCTLISGILEVGGGFLSLNPSPALPLKNKGRVSMVGNISKK